MLQTSNKSHLVYLQRLIQYFRDTILHFICHNLSLQINQLHLAIWQSRSTSVAMILKYFLLLLLFAFFVSKWKIRKKNVYTSIFAPIQILNKITNQSTHCWLYLLDSYLIFVSNQSIRL